MKSDITISGGEYNLHTTCGILVYLAIQVPSMILVYIIIGVLWNNSKTLPLSALSL